MWHLFRDWKRLQLRASNYKNHRIFTLRCLHKDLIPVSIKLKSTLITEKARKIIRKAEKDLLQARIKAINSILDNVAKQTEESRSQLVSIISAQRLRECQGFVDKVGEIRFTKVKQRQLNKYNILLNKKQGNITRANAITPSNSNNLASQAGRQLLSSPLGKEATYLRQVVRQALSFPLGKKAVLPRQLLTFPWVKEAILPRLLLSFLLRKEVVLPRQLLTFPWVKEAILPRLLLSFLLRKEVVSLRQLLTFLLGKEAIYLRQAGRQVLSFPLGEGSILP